MEFVEVSFNAPGFLVAVVLLGLFVFILRVLPMLVTKWKLWREHRRLAKFSHLCTHTFLSPREDGRITYSTSFISYLDLPQDAFALCTRYRKLAYDTNLPSAISRYWAMNPQAWIDAEEEHDRQLAQSNRSRL